MPCVFVCTIGVFLEPAVTVVDQKVALCINLKTKKPSISGKFCHDSFS